MLKYIHFEKVPEVDNGLKNSNYCMTMVGVAVAPPLCDS